MRLDFDQFSRVLPETLAKQRNERAARKRKQAA